MVLAGNKGAPWCDVRRGFGWGLFFFFFFWFFHRRGAEAPRRVDVLRWRLFPVSAGRTRCGGRELFFVWTERHQEGRVCRFFPRAEGRYCQDARCQNTQQSPRRSPRRFNTPTAEKLNSTKPVAALRLSGSVGTHVIIVCSIIFLGRPHLHFSE